MKWWWCCCCRCCSREKDKPTTLDDVSSLIPDGHATPSTATTISGDTEVQAFYVPRRHSSFHASTYTAVSVQPGRAHSDSCSSSGDEEAPIPEQRGRCWSTIPATSATDITSLLAARSVIGRDMNSFVNSRSFFDLESTKSSLSFDKHVLSEIAETEPGTTDEGGDGGSPKTDAEVYGYLTFSTAYDEPEQRLIIFLEKAADLPKKSSAAHYGTFVKLIITSSRKNFRLSKTIKNTLNPIYKEQHVFNTNRSKWKSSNNILRLSVYDCDRQGRHDAIGHAVIPLEKVDWENEEKHCLPLTPMSVPTKNIGQILTGLYYSAIKSLLSVHIIKARRLKLDSEQNKRHIRPLNRDVYDTFAKVTLMCAGQKVKTEKSRVFLDTPDPFYNHKCNFIVPAQYLLDSSIVVTIMVRGVLGRSIPLGRVTAGPYTETGSGSLTQWGRMAQECRSIVQWRNLYL